MSDRTGAKRRCATCDQARRELQGTHRRVCDRCQRNARRASRRNHHVTSRYGLTVTEHEALVEYLDGRCHICHGERPYELAVDHDHATGLARGVLCKRCNKLLRDVGDEAWMLLSASQYLNRPPAERLGIVAVHQDHRGEDAEGESA